MGISPLKDTIFTEITLPSEEQEGWCGNWQCQVGGTFVFLNILDPSFPLLPYMFGQLSTPEQFSTLC